MNQLATLLRDDVTATEPTHGLDAQVPVALGRKRLRARRWVSGAAAVAVLAVGAVTVPVLTGRDPATAPVSSTTGLADHVRPVLLRSLPDLGQPVQHDSADQTEVTWGGLAHQVSVEVERVPWSDDQPLTDTVVTQTLLGTVGPDDQQSYAWADVRPERLADVNPSDRYSARRAELVRDGVRVRVTERVPEGRPFAVPVADLRALAADPEVGAAP
jgi:hypothetical protein